MTRRLRVILLGSGVLGYSLMCSLIRSTAVELVGILPWSLGPGRRASDPMEQALVATTRRLRLELGGCHSANSARFAAEIEQRRVDCVLVGAWGEILKTDLLHQKGVHFINCHPSLLPAHRGPNPYCSVLLHGEHSTGVTFHVMEQGIDTGPVLAQQTLTVNNAETGGELRQRCARLAYDMVDGLMAQLCKTGTGNAIPQDQLGRGSYFPALKSHNALVPWHLRAEQITNHVRAVQPWLLPRLAINTVLGRTWVVVRRTVSRPIRCTSTQAGTVVDYDDETLWISCGDPTYETGFHRPQLKLASVALNPALSRLLLLQLAPTGYRLTNSQAMGNPHQFKDP